VKKKEGDAGDGRLWWLTWEMGRGDKARDEKRGGGGGTFDLRDYIEKKRGQCGNVRRGSQLQR